MLRKLMKKCRKPNFSLPTRDDPSVNDSRPMDTQEQEELVRSFEKSHAQQSRFWRRFFSALLFGYVVFLVYSICQQALDPWELRYYAYFMEEVDSWMILFTDCVAVMVCSMVITGLLHKSKNGRQWLWYSCYIGTIPAIFWLYYMSRLPTFRWDVWWLPFGPLIGAISCLYVDHLIMESDEEIRKLRSYMYAYKAS